MHLSLVSRRMIHGMSDRACWDTRYDTPELIHGEGSSEFLLENIDLLPNNGIAVDLAAGEGRNALFLAERGWQVIALDISSRALRKCKTLARERAVSVDAAVVDLTSFVFPIARFDLILCFNYLQRDIVPAMKEGVLRGGAIIFETLTTAHLRWKPGFNPDFLLRAGELIDLFRGLHVMKYREADLRVGDGSVRSVASIIARKD